MRYDGGRERGVEEGLTPPLVLLLQASPLHANAAPSANDNLKPHNRASFLSCVNNTSTRGAALHASWQTTGDAAATSERLHRETEVAIAQVQRDVAASKAAVVDMLVKHATTVVLQP